jgi:ribosomal protein S18 acetylase RimI-like enzyme
MSGHPDNGICRRSYRVPRQQQAYDSRVIDYAWRGAFDSAEVERLHAECFDRQPDEWDWASQVARHSLGWVIAREDGRLVGWVNVAWDGAGHAFILDTIVAGSHRRRGIATQLVAAGTAGARDAGCEWLHVDFEDHLTAFYVGACGFSATKAGLIRL